MSEAKKQNKFETKKIVVVGLMAAVICVIGPWAIPIGLVPISFTNLAIYITLYVLGWKLGTMSYIIYLLIGLVGLPVFSGLTGGPGKLLGPTGGYLIGFIAMAVISGVVIDKWGSRKSDKEWIGMIICVMGMIVGTAVCYLFGTVWLAKQAGYSFEAALAAGVLPFIPGDLIKIIIAGCLGPQIRKPLRKIGWF